jgi:hypothetical protein
LPLAFNLVTIRLQKSDELLVTQMSMPKKVSTEVSPGTTADPFAISEVLRSRLTKQDLHDIATIRSINDITTAREQFPIITRLMNVLEQFHGLATPLARALLLTMRNRIQHSMSDTYDTSPLTAALDHKDMELALRKGSKMFNSFIKDSLFTQIEHFLNQFPIVTRPKSTTINDLRLCRVSQAVEIAFDAVEFGQCHAGSFVCPITYEDETDVVILITEPPRPALAGLRREDTRKLIDCPLNTMIHSRLRNALLRCIDHPISLIAFREAAAVGRPIKVSPMTRRNVLGVLTLGCHPSHVGATNWTLFELVSGGKKLGNPDLWFAVIWLLIEDGKIPFLTEILPFVREHMRYRLRHSRAYCSLTALPDFVSYDVTLGTACWCALSSPAFHGVPIHLDTFRLHMQHTRPLFELCKLAGYDIPPAIDLYNRRLRVLITLRHMAITKFEQMKALVRALTQAVIVIVNVSPDLAERERKLVTHIPIDGPASPEQIADVMQLLPKWCADVTREDVIGIAGLLTHVNISLADVPMGINWVAPALPEVAVNWPHYEGVEKNPVAICPKTVRPFSMVVVGGRRIPWRHAYAYRFGDGRIFSCAMFFGRFVHQYRRFPSEDDLLLFIWAKYATNEFASTLPSDARAMIATTIDAFAQITASMSPRECARRFFASVRLEDRTRLES